jgi:hypothetical protein
MEELIKAQNNIINLRKKTESFNLFSSFDFKVVKRKGATAEITEQRDLLAKLLNRSFSQVAGLTRNWTIQEMFEIRRKAESFKANPQALAWKLIKEHNKKIKEMLKLSTK